jgi:hypothetical protein
MRTTNFRRVFSRERCIETRGFSAYLTALIRYELLLLGPHKYYNGDDWGAARMAELDAKTVKAFHVPPSDAAHSSFGSRPRRRRRPRTHARRALSANSGDCAVSP